MSLISLACLSSAVACGSHTDVTSTEEGLHVTPDTIAAVVTQTNIVSDEPGVAKMTDPDLINAWGLAFNPTGKAWVSAAETGLSPVYDEDGNALLKVTIPPPPDAEPPSAPTGQVFNSSDEAFMGDKFIFVTENGTIAGWQPSDGTTAVLRADNSGSEAIYKGVAIASASGQERLYATDFHNAKVDVYDSMYQPVTGIGDFSDTSLPAGFAPFNVLTLGQRLLVSYALQDEDAEDDVAGPGNGYVDVYDLDGHLLQRLLSGGELNSPWGMAVGPAGKKNHNDLLVGNFGDGKVHVYDLSPLGRQAPIAARLKGSLGDAPDHALVIDGLWALVYGPGAAGFEEDEIYFTAGPDDEQHGLFGELDFE